MISQGFELPWDHRNALVLPLKLGTFFLDIKSGSCNNAYILLEFQKAEKQKAAKRNVDYFQRVCDANIMHVVFSRGFCQIPKKSDHIVSFLKLRIIYCNEIPESRFPLT